MSSTDNQQQFRVFSIRNLLLAVTGVLTLFVVSLSVSQMNDALSNRNVAERAQNLNALIDDIVQFKLALAEERLFTNMAYGFPAEVPSNFTTSISLHRSTVDTAYDNIQAGLSELGPFDGKEGNKDKYEQATAEFDALRRDFREKYDAYTEARDVIDQDFETFGTETDTSGAGNTSNIMDGVIDAAAKIRDEIEANYDFGNDRIGTVNRLKNLLWIMNEYAIREAAILGDHIVAGIPLGRGEPIQGPQYTAIAQGAFMQVQTIAMSTSATTEIAAQIPTIQKTYVQDFETVRFGIYDKSAEAKEMGDETVVYTVSDEDYNEEPITPDGWIGMARAASAPISKMTNIASGLAQKLNEEAVSTANRNVMISTILIVVSLAVGAIAFWVVLVRVVKPVNQLSDVMIILSQGNLEIEVPNANRDDEMGDMAKSVQVFKENAIERRDMEAQQREREEQERIREEEAAEQKRREEEERRLADEQREEEARAERRRAMLELADNFEASVMELVEGVSNSAFAMESAAKGMAMTATDTSEKSDVVLNAAQQASSNAQMVASAAEELSSSVREITGQTNQSSAAARDAVTRTVKAATDVAVLEEAGQKIGSVVELINDIAEQTNLLALNATIEAARAGDAGKGFAVVASEVKSLANQTAKATQEISEQVDGMQQATSLAVTAIEEIKRIIGDIETTSISIASAVEEQDASTQEIARNVAEVSTGTEEVTSNIHAVNEGATTTGTSAEQVLSAAQLLTQQSDGLRAQVEDFLKTIRA